MKAKYKKVAYEVLNVCVIFLLLFQSIYPFFYSSRVYAQVEDPIEEVAEVRESTPSGQLDEVTQEIPSLLEEEQTDLPTTDGTADVVEENIESDSTGGLTTEENTDISENPASDTIGTIETDGKENIVDVEISDDDTETSAESDISTDIEKELESDNLLFDSTTNPETDVISGKESKDDGLSKRTGKKKSKGENKKDLDYKPGEVLVKYKDNEINLQRTSGRAEASFFAHTNKLEKIKESREGNISLLRIKDNKSVKEKVKELKNDRKVEYAEPNYRLYPQTINTNDTHKQELWGLDNTGQSVNGYTGSADADIDAVEAWAVNEGVNDLIVAVIDSGVAYNHPDLINNMWDGSSCNDSLGAHLGGCLYGYDFEDDDKDPEPTDSTHGTLVAGVIAATRNNNQGVLGVAPKAKIMALKFGFDVASEVMAIDFAIQNGAKVINASYGGAFYSQAQHDAINRFLNAGGLFIAAAGNESSNNESAHFYPSDLDLNNIISVASTNQDDDLSNFSNYGSTSVDVAAPGENIYSTNQTFSVSNVISEDFESLTPPAIPSGWTKSGTFGTYDLGGDGWKVLYGDLAYPYSSSNNSTITTQTYNLNGASDVELTFYTRCDTEYPLDGWEDYMAVEASSNGSTFSEVDLGWGKGKYDEPMIDILNGEDPLDDSGFAGTYMSASLPSEYYTSNFKLRFRWVTDSDSNTGTYGDGCFVDDITLAKISLGSYEYEYADGTSFAAPYTAGLAALLWSIDNSLTYTEIRNAILDTGDTIPDLVGKTTSGKRINAYNAIQSFNSTKEITSFNFTSPSVTGVINEGAHTVSLEVPYGTDVASLTPTITTTGASVSPASGVPQNFSSPVTYTVTAVNSTTQDYIVTVTVEAPSTITTVSSGVYTVGSDTITDVPFDTSKADFFSNITKDEPNQAWDDTGINDPVLTDDVLEVTAQDGTTTKTYTISVDEVTPILDLIGNKTTDELTLLTFTATATDPDGPSTSFYLTGEPPGASINGVSGEFTFTPSETQGPGEFNLTVWVTDGTNTDFEEISITVNEANVPPVAQEVSDSLDEDGSKTITLVATDSDKPVNTITYSIVSDVSHGSLGTLSGNQVLYTPDADYNGGDSFTYNANDGTTNSNTATVNITVNPVNDTPIANSDSYDTDEDTAVLITLTGNDIDEDSLSFNLIDFPTNGSLETLSDTQLNYTPDTDYVGSDSFTFRANDGLEDSNVATIDIIIGAINDTPELDPIGNKTIDELATLSFTATATDSDSALTYSLVNAPTGASIEPSSGAFTFTPTESQGPDSYTLTVFVTDGNTSDEEEITITVNEINIVPVVNDFSVSTDEDTEKLITLNHTDPDLPENTITYTVDTAPTHGSLGSIIGNQITYTPDSEYNGTDSFTYKVHDGSADSNFATVTITVVSINDTPTITTSAPTTATEDVLYSYDAEVSDVDGPSAVWTKSGSDTCGGSLDSSTGNYTFTPLGPTPATTCDVSVTVSDYGSPNLSETQTTTITITAVNDLPISVNDDYSVDEDITLNVAVPGVLDNDSDPEGSEMSAVLVSDVSNGLLSLNSNGSFEYTPNSNYYGTDSFIYKVSDGTDNSSNATVDITVNSINDAPTAYGTSSETDEDNSVDISLSGTDPENDVLTYLIGVDPTHGSVSIENDVATYTPNPGYNGTDSFEFKVNDGSLDSNNAEVTLTIIGINDAPVIDAIADQTIDEYYNLQITPVVSDVDGGTPTFSLTNSFVANSSINIDTGLFNFTPDETQGGSIFDFTIQVDDGNDVNNLASESFSVTVDEINNGPVAVDDTSNVDEDLTLLITHASLLANDTDPDNSTEDFSIVSVSGANPVGSTLVFNADTIEFVAPDNFNGEATFEYLMSDGELTDTALVKITVNPVNDQPEAADDTGSLDEDTPLYISKVSLLLNDDDIDGDALELTDVINPISGAVIIDGDNIVFTPTANYYGPASFDYTITDGLLTDTATVYLDINPINDSPVLGSVGDKTIDELSELTFTATATDNDPTDVLTFSLSNEPVGASINPSTGEFSFSATEVQGPNTYFVDINVSDGIDTDTETTTITVNEVNVAPIVTELWSSTDEESSTLITLVGNDSDIPLQSLSYSVTNASHGSLSIVGDEVIYTPNTDYFGDDTFTYKANDGVTDSSSETVHITVNAVNDSPVANPDSSSGDEDVDVVIAKTELLLNDTDVDNITLTISNVFNPTNGTVIVDGDNIIFTPDNNFNGTAYFDYTISDGKLTDNTTVTITINPINDAPVANSDSVTVDEDSVVSITLTGSDVDNDLLSYFVVDTPTHGSLGTISADQVDYTPNENYEGSDFFTYRVNDGLLDSNVATINITVTEFNDPPVLDSIGNKIIDELTTLTFTANASDPDSPVTYSLTDAPTGATINTNTGEFDFTPTENQGPEIYTLSVSVTDGTSTDSETITITVNEVNIVPVAYDITTSTNEDTSKTIVLNATDADLPVNTLTYIIDSGPSHGTLGTISGDEITYTPFENYNGPDSFTYKANDGLSDSNVATVTITVDPINDSPVANQDNASVDEDTELTIAKADLISNDTDADFDTLSIINVSDPINGIVYIDGTNIVFKPSSNFNGVASFKYTLSDGSLSDIGMVYMDVNPINDAPTASNDTYATTQEAPITLTLLGDDIEGDSLTYSISFAPTNGSLSTVSGNQVTYTSDTGYIGDDSFTYIANDGEYDSNGATIDITVLPPPVISGESSIDVESISVTVTWTTDHPSTSRVIYDTVSHTTLGASPNYGYAYSTIEIDNSPMVISHSVTISPLSPETTYYYRAVSHGSPEVVGDDELSFTTKSAVEEDTEAPDRPENVETDYNSNEKTIKLTWENNDNDIDEVYVYMGDNEDFDKNSDSRITRNDADDEDVTVGDIEPGKTYYFKLVAEDKAENKSKTRTVSIEIPEETEDEEEVIVTDLSVSAPGASDENLESGEETGEGVGEGDVLGTETNKDAEKITAKDDLEKEADTSNNTKYFIIFGLVFVVAVGIFLSRKKK